ncbi:MAG: hypothetical protein HUU10_05610 [Bacteroidetes bacterium]|nr:hypothetical protein [Bacteroidota bacterium]
MTWFILFSFLVDADIQSRFHDGFNREINNNNTEKKQKEQESGWRDRRQQSLKWQGVGWSVSNGTYP